MSAEMPSIMRSAPGPRGTQLDLDHTEDPAEAPRARERTALDWIDPARRQLAGDLVRGHMENASSLALSRSTARAPIRFPDESIVAVVRSRAARGWRGMQRRDRRCIAPSRET